MSRAIISHCLHLQTGTHASARFWTAPRPPAWSAVTHVEHNPISVNGSELRLTQQQDMPPSPELYATGFPGSTDHAELAHALGVPSDIARRRTGRNGPFANIAFSNAEEAKEAMARFAVARTSSANISLTSLTPTVRLWPLGSGCMSPGCRER
jgi:hypothetical protein